MAGRRGAAAVTRQRILTAARELFTARGVDSVSVRDIAAVAVGRTPEPRPAVAAEPDGTGGPGR